MKEEEIEKTISTPEGDVSLTVSQVEESPQTITKVGKEDLAEFLQLASLVPEFVSAYLPDSESVGLQECDEAFRLWLTDKSSGYSDGDVISILGAYLGERCCEGLDMEWVIVSDQYGKDFAVSSIEVESLGFPFSTVAKRIESRESGFLVGVYRAIEDNTNSADTKKR